jgi:dipeptidyl aminopeptidase/acylaminoacyl peptidase
MRAIPAGWLLLPALLIPAMLPRLAAQAGPGPSFRSAIELRSAGAPAIAPDGRAVAWTVRSTEWDANRFDIEIWLWREGREPVQLTRTPRGSSTAPAFSPDGRWLAFLADRGDGQQLHLIGVEGGEAMPLTWRKGGVNAFAFSPDGRRVALLATEEETAADRQRKARYGEFAVEDGEYRMQHLWLLDVDPARWTPDTATAPRPARLTGGDGFTVGGFAFSPDGARIAFDHRRDPLITSGPTADISVVDVASGRVTPLVARPGADAGPVWSPDGRWIAFTTSGGDTVTNFFRNNQLARVPAAGGAPQRLAAGFDEQIGGVTWTAAGLRFTAWQRTRRQVFQVDPASGGVSAVAVPGLDRVMAWEPAPDGRSTAILAQADGASLPEVYRVVAGRPERLTDLTRQLAGWALGTSEVITWRSRDGTPIEGVLHRPPGFDPSRRYPLLVVIHGGPTGIDAPSPAPFYVYPIPQWVARGALVLRPNYRGSAGYGERFRSLNVRNLGVGDLWDVMSGVEHLAGQGIVDTTRMGAMGWSQGGYISAFLATNTTRFRAISVGAGIANWVTYYVSTDIHPFTRQYLGATPWEDPAIYATTSPMTTIRQARTPTLIQHGEFDRRVPTQNAYELYQGLQDQGVPSELVIYKGFGHGITKPKEQLAAVWHNWRWFARHLWGEEVELPLGEGPEAGRD